MSVIRMRNASMRIPAESANPNWRIMESSLSTKPAKTETMMIAAATTTRLAWWNPSTTAVRADSPWAWTSRIEVPRNTW